MSSWLVQVTVSPTFTFSSGGVNVKLSIEIAVVSARALRLASGSNRAAAARLAPRIRISRRFMVSTFPSALQRRVDDGEALVAHLEVDAGHAEHVAQLGVF